jgi:hypothetical protein
VKKRIRNWTSQLDLFRSSTCILILCVLLGASTADAGKWLVIPKSEPAEVNAAVASIQAMTSKPTMIGAQSAPARAQLQAAQVVLQNSINNRGVFLRQQIKAAENRIDTRLRTTIGAAAARETFEAEALENADAIVAEYSDRAEKTDVQQAFPKDKFFVVKSTSFSIDQLDAPVGASSVDASRRPYGIGQVKAPAAWKCLGTKGKGILVAVIDSGVRGTHEQLKGRVLKGKSYIDASRPTDTTDGFGHGTHVAATIAGKTYGVAPEASIVPYRVFNSRGDGDNVSLLQAIEDAIDRKVDVINMSLRIPVTRNGSVPTSDPVIQRIQQALNRAKLFGIVSVAAAGNDGIKNAMGIPARFSDVITVAASDENDQITSFSQRGNVPPAAAGKPDISAPGERILSAGFRSDIDSRSDRGTSMAAPHVSGAVALMLAAEKVERGSNAFDRIRQAIVSTAGPISGSASLRGAGLLNSHKAALSYLNLTECPAETPKPPVKSPGNGNTELPTGGLLAERKKSQEARFAIYDEFAATREQTKLDLLAIRRRFRDEDADDKPKDDKPEDGPGKETIQGPGDTAPDGAEGNGGIEKGYEGDRFGEVGEEESAKEEKAEEAPAEDGGAGEGPSGDGPSDGGANALEERLKSVETKLDQLLERGESWPGARSGDVYHSEEWLNFESKPALLSRTVSEKLLARCTSTGELTVEVSLKAHKLNQKGPARIVSFSRDTSATNFTIGHEGEHLVLRLRTDSHGGNGHQITLAKVTGEWQHLQVSYRSGLLTVSLNGRLLATSSDIQGNFSNWEPMSLILGDEHGQESRAWDGEVRRLAIRSQYNDSAMAERQYRLIKE